MHRKKLIAIALSAVLAFGSFATVSASTIEELQQQQAETEADLSQVNSSINSIEDQKAVLMQDIDEKSAELVMTIASIDSLNYQIDQKNNEIAQTTADLGVAEEKKAVEYEAMKKRIQYLYENGGNAGWATFLLEEQDITELLNQVEYTQQMYDYDRQCLEEYAATVQEVSSLKSLQEQEQAELLSMKNEQEMNQQNLEVMLEDMRLTSDNYDQQLAEAQSIADQYRQLIADQNEQIAILVEQQRREAEAAAAAQAAAEAAAAQAAAEAAAAAAAAEQDAAAQAAAAQAAAEAAAQAAAAQAQAAGVDYSYTPDNTDYSSYSGGGSAAAEEPSYSAPSGGGGGQAVIDYALQFVGNPYVWGGNSLTNGTDCSGYVHLIYAHFGYSVPRSSAAMPSAGRGVSYAEAQPGDIICYSGHCALYLGGGAIVHASDERTGIKISYDATYRPIIAVRRVIG
jgi:cell wall-associated NlpC family hydrolase/peptidoglycan hydrolase CwlO-like protein